MLDGDSSAEEDKEERETRARGSEKDALQQSANRDQEEVRGSIKSRDPMIIDYPRSA